jgi:hypothetical protein
MLRRRRRIVPRWVSSVRTWRGRQLCEARFDVGRRVSNMPPKLDLGQQATPRVVVDSPSR